MNIIGRKKYFTRWMNLVWIVILVLAMVAMPARVSAQSSSNCTFGYQATGASYEVCMPPSGTAWNGDVLLFAHGYVSFDEPLAIQTRQFMLMDGANIADIITSTGYAFATTSYSKNGLAVLPAVQDIVDLAQQFKQEYPTVQHTYLAGVSEGGLVTTLAIEQYPQLFTAGLAMCGPLGDFSQQINYWGDFRVLFDYYFPGLLPGRAMSIPQDVIDNFYYGYWPVIRKAVKDNPGKVIEMLKVAHAAYDPNDTNSLVKTVYDLLWYSVFATNNGQSVLGGQPYGNQGHIYSGSGNDNLLNLMVNRYQSDSMPLLLLKNRYQPTGELKVPLVTMHDTQDQIVPYWHEAQYAQRVHASGSDAFYTNIAIQRYGHCEFTSSEALAAFVTMTYKATGQLPVGLAQALTSGPAQQNFLSMLASLSIAPMKVEIPGLPFQLNIP